MLQQAGFSSPSAESRVWNVIEELLLDERGNWKMWGVDVLLVLAERHGAALWSQTTRIGAICGALKEIVESDNSELASKVGWLAAYHAARHGHKANADGTDRIGHDGILGMATVVDVLRRTALAGRGDGCAWLAARAATAGEGPADDTEEIRRAITACLQRTGNAAASASSLRAVSWFVPRMDLGLDGSFLRRVETLEACRRAGLTQLAKAAKLNLVLTVRGKKGKEREQWLDLSAEKKAEKRHSAIKSVHESTRRTRLCEYGKQEKKNTRERKQDSVDRKNIRVAKWAWRCFARATTFCFLMILSPTL
jgi:hypothetical protein